MKINNLLKKINKIPKPVLASVVYMLVVFFQSGVNLLTTPLYSRVLNTTEYGMTTTYNSWYNILIIFVTLNLYAGVYNNALLDFQNDRDKMTSSFLSVSIFLSFIFLVITFLFQDIFSSLFNLPFILLFFMFLNFLTYPAWGFFLSREKFDYRFIKPLILTVITFLLNPLFGMLGIYLFPESKAIAKIIFSGFPVLFVNFMLFIQLLRNGKVYYHSKYWKYALSFNVPLLPHYLSQVILSSSDRIMIQKMLGYSAAGIYGVSYSVSTVIQGLFTGINSAFVPYTYKNMQSHHEHQIFKYSKILLLLVGIFSVLLSLCAPEIVSVLAPSDYFSAQYVIPPVILGLYYLFLSSFFSNIEFYYKKNIFVTVGTSVAAVINIILNAIFIPKYGLVAAGYTTAIGYLVLEMMHIVFLKKITSLRIYDIKYILMMQTIFSFLILGVVFLYPYFIIRYVMIFLAIVISCIYYKKIIVVFKRLFQK